MERGGFSTYDTVDGQNPAPVEVGSLSHYLQGFIHTRWLFWDFVHQQYVLVFKNHRSQIVFNVGNNKYGVSKNSILWKKNIILTSSLPLHGVSSWLRNKHQSEAGLDFGCNQKLFRKGWFPLRPNPFLKSKNAAPTDDVSETRKRLGMFHCLPGSWCFTCGVIIRSCKSSTNILLSI